VYFSPVSVDGIDTWAIDVALLKQKVADSFITGNVVIILAHIFYQALC
jgi:hypothetical protein